MSPILALGTSLLTFLAPQVPTQTTTPTTTQVTATADLYLVDYGTQLELRDRLIAGGSFYGDLGRYGIARLTAHDVAALQAPAARIPALRTGEELVVTARTRSGAGLIVGRLLLARRALFLCAVPPGKIPKGCSGSGLHGGVQVIPLDRPYAPVRHTLPPRAELGPDPKIQAMVAQVNQTNLLTHVTALAKIYTRRASRPENAQAVAYVTNELKKLKNITFKTEVFNSRYGPNIIAELKGNDLAGEIVMVGAHLDSLAGASTSNAPGADDNASGSAATLEIARILSTQKLRRTVRFAWWNAEELGLIGSQAYAAAAKARKDKIIAYVNTDMNAYRASNDTRSVDYVTNDSTVALIDALAKATATYVPTLPTKRGALGGGTSDHRSFFRNGFPAAFPFEDIGQYSPYIHSTRDVVGTSANDFVLSKLITQSLVAGLAELAEIAVANPGKFELFGTGCQGGVRPPLTCASNNPTGGSLAALRRAYEYCYQVENTGTRRVTAFEIFTRSTGGNVTVTASLYADNNGTPSTSPAVRTTMTIGSTAGFYRATLATPVSVTGRFYVALDHAAQTTYLSQLNSGAGGSGFYRRGTANWSRSGIISRPSFRVTCAGGQAVPTLGGSGSPLIGRTFDITLKEAMPSTNATLVTGASNTTWSGASLPLTFPGATGCPLRVAPHFLGATRTDAQGSARFSFPIPNQSALIGAVVFQQWLVFDSKANPLGVAVTAGAKITVGG